MYYLHQFVVEQPDLNFHHGPVKEELVKIIRYWLDQGVDGFRVDAINHSFEVEDYADEPLVDPLGDPNLYSNLRHIHTMDLVSVQLIRWNGFSQIRLTQGAEKVRIVIMTNNYCSASFDIHTAGQAPLPARRFKSSLKVAIFSGLS
jgi:alpha-glucosidase